MDSTFRIAVVCVFTLANRRNKASRVRLFGRVLRSPKDGRRVLFVGHAVRIGDRLHLESPGRLEVDDGLAGGGTLRDWGPNRVQTPFERRYLSAALMSST